jgi:excinuclease ABC subunit B
VSRRRDDLLRQLTRSSTCATTSTSRRHVPRARRRRRDLPAYEDDDRAIRFELFGDEVESILESIRCAARSLASSTRSRSTRRATTSRRRSSCSAPASRSAVELESGSPSCEGKKKLLEAQRLEQRTRYDLEMLRDRHCQGIENYSATSTAARPGEPPSTLLNYFPKTSCSSSTRATSRAADRRHVPRRPRAQGDAGRVRLPPAEALDNRPLKFEEFEGSCGRSVYVSATPAELRARSRARTSSRADHPADRPRRPGSRSAQSARPGRRPARRDQGPRVRRRSACSSRR